MKKIIYVLALLIGNFMLAQSGAKIEFKQKDNTIDYGTIYRGADDGVRTFEFTNTGDAPLVIKDVRSTCGCTVPEWTKDAVKPGGSGTVKIKYNMNPGPIRKTVTVESNAVNAEEGRVALKIKGEVIDKELASPLEKKKTSPMQ